MISLMVSLASNLIFRESEITGSDTEQILTLDSGWDTLSLWTSMISSENWSPKWIPQRQTKEGDDYKGVSIVLDA